MEEPQSIEQQLQKALEQLDQVKALIREHEEQLRYAQGFGTPAEQVAALFRQYEQRAIGAQSGAEAFRDDVLSYFRALAIVLDMTMFGGTHAEKNARLRGGIELLASTIEKLRRQDLERLSSSGGLWPDTFRSDWPTRRLMERIRDLEAQVASQQPVAEGRPIDASYF